VSFSAGGLPRVADAPADEEADNLLRRSRRRLVVVSLVARRGRTVVFFLCQGRDRSDTISEN
jgi:hypothetical protein